MGGASTWIPHFNRAPAASCGMLDG